jgi:LDH2 family malate/lactate/ureidoglycolate dehydrogenase
MSTVTRPGVVVLTASDLDALLRRSFRGVGLAEADADAVSEVLVDANLRGIDSHGIERAPIYMHRVHTGLAGGTDRMSIRADTGAMLWVDAGQALGPAAALRATDLAVERARTHGIALVSVGRSTHFGHAGFYARRGAAQGLLAVIASNAPASMAPHGAATAFLGANPLAVGAPIGRHGEYVLDMSTSVVARGRIRRAGNLGAVIPEGLALDADGRSTTDPAAALAGSVLPVGGPKGSGLALAVSLLTAFLADADFDDEMGSMYSDFSRPQNIGHVILMIDPGRLTDTERASARAEAMIDRLHALLPAEGAEDVRAAGEQSDRYARERLAAGIPIATEEIEALAASCSACGVADVAAELARLVVPAPAR